MTAADPVICQRRGNAYWISINRPERRNALTDEVLEEVARAWREAVADGRVRAIVLTGVGDRAFCAGADLTPGRNFRSNMGEPTLAYADLARLLRASPKPSIARVNGACVAGGMGLLAMTDIAIAAESARFGLPEVRVGLFPMQVCALLDGLVSRRTLRAWSLGGELFGAAEALGAGLVTAVVPDSELDQAVEEQVRRLCAGSPVAMRRGLAMLRRIEGLDADSALAFAEAQIALASMSDDAREGLTAFNEKRPPRWATPLG